jgi:hypothetical protein
MSFYGDERPSSKLQSFKQQFNERCEAVERFNKRSENQFSTRYHRFVYAGIRHILSLIRTIIVIGVKLPLILLQGLFHTQLFLIEKLTIKITMNQPDSSSSFSHILDYAKGEMNQPVFLDEHNTHSQKPTFPLIYKGIYQAIAKKLSLPYPDNAVGKIKLFLHKALVLTYGVVAISITILFRLINEKILGTLLHRTVPFMAEYVIKPLYNLIMAIPLLAYDGGRTIMDKIRKPSSNRISQSAHHAAAHTSPMRVLGSSNSLSSTTSESYQRSVCSCLFDRWPFKSNHRKAPHTAEREVHQEMQPVRQTNYEYSRY